MSNKSCKVDTSYSVPMPLPRYIFVACKGSQGQPTQKLNKLLLVLDNCNQDTGPISIQISSWIISGLKKKIGVGAKFTTTTHPSTPPAQNGPYYLQMDDIYNPYVSLFFFTPISGVTWATSL